MHTPQRNSSPFVQPAKKAPASTEHHRTEQRRPPVELDSRMLRHVSGGDLPKKVW